MSRPVVDNSDIGRLFRSDSAVYSVIRQYIDDRITERKQLFDTAARAGVLNPAHQLQSAAVTLGRLIELESLLQDLDSLLKGAK